MAEPDDDQSEGASTATADQEPEPEGDEEVYTEARQMFEKLQESKQASATKIQCAFRSKAARSTYRRKVVEKQDKAATKIQARYRGSKVRRRSKQNKAATKIQARYRGSRVRRSKHGGFKRPEQNKAEAEVVNSLLTSPTASAAIVLETERSPEDGTSSDQANEAAAIKIQSLYRGHRARSTLTSEREMEPASAEPASPSADPAPPQEPEEEPQVSRLADKRPEALQLASSETPTQDEPTVWDSWRVHSSPKKSVRRKTSFGSPSVRSPSVTLSPLRKRSARPRVDEYEEDMSRKRKASKFDRVTQAMLHQDEKDDRNPDNDMADELIRLKAEQAAYQERRREEKKRRERRLRLVKEAKEKEFRILEEEEKRRHKALLEKEASRMKEEKEHKQQVREMARRKRMEQQEAARRARQFVAKLNRERSGKPRLYQRIENKYRQNVELPEMESRARKLANRKRLYRPIKWSRLDKQEENYIVEHDRREAESKTFYEKLIDGGNRGGSRHRKLKLRALEKQHKKEMARERRDRMRQYSKAVKEVFRPRIDPKKSEELERRVHNLRNPVKIAHPERRSPNVKRPSYLVRPGGAVAIRRAAQRESEQLGRQARRAQSQPRTRRRPIPPSDDDSTTRRATSADDSTRRGDARAPIQPVPPPRETRPQRRSRRPRRRVKSDVTPRRLEDTEGSSQDQPPQLRDRGRDPTERASHEADISNVREMERGIRQKEDAMEGGIGDVVEVSNMYIDMINKKLQLLE